MAAVAAEAEADAGVAVEVAGAAVRADGAAVLAGVGADPVDAAVGAAVTARTRVKAEVDVAAATVSVAARKAVARAANSSRTSLPSTASRRS